MRIPVIGFSAWSGVGKTTVIEKLVSVLTGRGLRVAVVKHDTHGFEMDQPGKDSWRFYSAGASAVVLTSPDKAALIRRGYSDLETCLSMIHDADVILVEGFKQAEIPRIGLSRAESGKGWTDAPQRFIALVTDEEAPDVSVPCFSFNNTEGLADFVQKEAAYMQEKDFTHFNSQGRAHMVEVGGKDETVRTATAAGRVLVNEQTFSLIRSGGVKKGDVLTVAQVAGIMAAKRTPDLIPMCHPVAISGIDLKLWLDEKRLSVEIEATVSCTGRTGVEMEALTAVSGAALTVYDMCKAVQRDMVIDQIRLMKKTGGVHGDYLREEGSNE